MAIVDVFDAVLQGDINMFKKYYDGNPNCLDKYNGLNLLQSVICKGGNYKERLDIISFLLNEGIDVNYLDSNNKQNALHYLFYNTQFGDGVLDGKYVLAVTKMLLDKGLNVNARDKYGAISLYYLLVGRLENNDVKSILQLLLDKEVDYLGKDNYGNSCLDYAKERSKRDEIVKLLEERK